MRKPLIITILCLLLVSCGSGSTGYNLVFDTDDEDKRSELTFAAQRVIERRLEMYGEKALDLKVVSGVRTPQIRVKMNDENIIDVLTADLISSFNLRIMKEALPGETDIISVEGHGDFSETGITEDQVEWFEASPDTNPEQGRVTITFSEEGRDLMEQVFKENSGKNIGLFVREHLVSKLYVDSDELLDEIVITEIPSLELAEIFADDVNVGLYVTFTPVE